MAEQIEQAEQGVNLKIVPATFILNPQGTQLFVKKGEAFTLPTGHQEEGDTGLIAALKREHKEEFNLDLVEGKIKVVDWIGTVVRVSQNIKDTLAQLLKENDPKIVFAEANLYQRQGNKILPILFCLAGPDWRKIRFRDNRSMIWRKPSYPIRNSDRMKIDELAGIAHDLWRQWLAEHDSAKMFFSKERTLV